MKSRATLIGLEIEGEWNVPLLRNAAEISRTLLLFARADAPSNSPVLSSVYTDVPILSPHAAEEPDVGESVGPEDKLPVQSSCLPLIDELVSQFDRVIACEATRQSRTVYDYPAPRGRVAVIVGNELKGVPKRVLKRVDQVVSIPMFGRGMSSVNVAVAGAVVLYALERDLARKRLRPSALSHRNIDLCIVAPPDPNELGSLLRSAWAFGWKRVFLDDRNGVWFSNDRSTVLAGRAASRREVNPLVVAPVEQMALERYDAVVVCDSVPQGMPLSRISLPTVDKLLLVYGDGDLRSGFASAERMFVDHGDLSVKPRFRHAGSILLSVISHILKRSQRG